MKKKSLICCSIFLIICLSVGLFWYGFVSYLYPARLNALYNHVLKSVPTYKELVGYQVEDEYSWGANSFSVPLSKNGVFDKLLVISTNVFSQIQDITLVDLTENISFVPVEDAVILKSIKLFNSIFTYTHISDSYVDIYGSQIVDFIGSGAINDIELDVNGKDIIKVYKGNLVSLYDYYVSNLKDGLVLEELSSYDVFCDRLLSYDYYYDMNDNCIVLSIVFDYKINHEHLKIYFKDGVVSCE